MSLEAFQLNGKNALVTGSHRGLGAAIALALAKAGANVGCHRRDPKPSPSCAEILAAGRKAFYFSGDLADAKGYLGPIERTVAKFGSIDILVNNAGVIRRAPASEYPTEFRDELIAVNPDGGVSRLDGVSRTTSQVPRYSHIHPPATMSTDMPSPCTEAVGSLRKTCGQGSHKESGFCRGVSSLSKLENANERASKNFSRFRGGNPRKWQGVSARERAETPRACLQRQTISCGA